DPIRIIADSHAKIPLESKVLSINSKTHTIIATTELAEKERLKRLEDKGVEIIITPSTNKGIDLQYLMKKLGERKIDSILLEGGSELNYSALEARIIDKVNIFIAPKLIGGRGAKTPIGGVGKMLMKDAVLVKDINIRSFEPDMMIEGYLTREG
ncbi:MAG: ribD, partial [Clostridia bacterium]|nr:ribD [Clostridia bacterium]